MLNTSNIMPLILAAGTNSDFLTHSGQPYPAMAMYRNKHLYEWVLAAIRGAGLRGGLMITGQDGVDPNFIRTLRGGETMAESLKIGLKEAGNAEYVLIATADLPDIAPHAVRFFLEDAISSKADIVYPVVPAALCEKAYPGMKRTLVRFREGVFTGGNLFLVRRQAMLDNWETITGFLELRKSKWKLARKLGLGVMAKMLCGLLSLAEVKTIADRLLGAKTKVTICDFHGAATIGADADTWEQYMRFINRKLET
ncbi:MAG: nucleotidyltransferase family protein [Patescibacteria group bacterium]|jgi:hypothetical protein